MILVKQTIKSVVRANVTANRGAFISLRKTKTLSSFISRGFAKNEDSDNFKAFSDLSKIDKRSFSNLSKDEQIAKIDEALNSQQKKEPEIEDDSSFDRPGTNSIYMFLIGGVGIVIGFFVLEMNSKRRLNYESTLNPLKAINGQVKFINSVIINVGQGEDMTYILQYILFGRIFWSEVIGGEWELKDTKGNSFGSDNLNGNYYLIYFGFCNCPDICPNTLTKISKALQRVKANPEGRFLKIKTIFVSIDPDRDTNEKIESFLKGFDKNIIGVTGANNNDPNLREMMKKFRIYSTKMMYEQTGKEKEEKFSAKDQKTKLQNDYDIDHTVLTYLMDDSNNYLAHISPNISEYDISKIIIENILANERDSINKYT